VSISSRHKSQKATFMDLTKVIIQCCRSTKVLLERDVAVPALLLHEIDPSRDPRPGTGSRS
jgi:hypothetical protein